MYTISEIQILEILEILHILEIWHIFEILYILQIWHILHILHILHIWSSLIHSIVRDQDIDRIHHISSTDLIVAIEVHLIIAHLLHVLWQIQ